MIYTLFSSSHCFFFFFFNDTATTEIYTLSLHDALPIYICGKTWKNGKFIVLRKTIRKRLIAKLNQVKATLRRRMHQPLAQVGRWVRSVVQGYFNYHAVPGNLPSLRSFRLEVRKRWLRVIRRRSQRSPKTWELFDRIAEQWLPIPKILHPYPHLRFDATHPR